MPPLWFALGAAAAVFRQAAAWDWAVLTSMPNEQKDQENIVDHDMGMDQYLLIPFLGEWTSIYQLFWCSPGVQGFDTLPYNCLTEANFGIQQSLKLPTLRGWRAAGRSGWKSNLWRQLGPRWPHFHQWQLDPFQRGLVLRDTEKTSPVFCLKTTTRGSALIGTC